jgi:SAM-dependent methyltransferase
MSHRASDRTELYRRLPPQETDRWWGELAQASPDGRVLEFGAGTGRLTDAFLAAGATVTAVEHDPAMLSSLRDRYGSGSDVEVIEADVTALPSADPVGLVALPASLLNELPDAAARRAALAEAARHCRPDGYVAIHLLSPWWLVGLTGHSVGHLLADDGRPLIEVGVEAGGFAPWTARREATLTYRFDDGVVLVDHLDAAVVTPGELEGALVAVGLELVAVHGASPPAAVADDDVAWHLLAQPVGFEGSHAARRI